MKISAMFDDAARRVGFSPDQNQPGTGPAGDLIKNAARDQLREDTIARYIPAREQVREFLLEAKARGVIEGFVERERSSGSGRLFEGSTFAIYGLDSKARYTTPARKEYGDFQLHVDALRSGELSISPKPQGTHHFFETLAREQGAPRSLNYQKLTFHSIEDELPKKVLTDFAIILTASAKYYTEHKKAGSGLREPAF